MFGLIKLQAHGIRLKAQGLEKKIRHSYSFKIPFDFRAPFEVYLGVVFFAPQAERVSSLSSRRRRLSGYGSAGPESGEENNPDNPVNPV
jgi:hypothetical protein